VLNVAVFGCGAVVMIYEIIGSRLVSPYIGSSTYIWTSLIGAILGSLSLGYWLGGRAADRRCEARHLAAIIFAAAGLVSVTTLVKDVFLSMLSASAMPLEIKALIAALVLFAPASVALGMVTPYAVKLKLSTLDTTGRTVGDLYALSTVGSILGTFAAGFFLLPFVGSVRTLYLIALVLFGLSIIVWPLRFSRLNIGIIVLYLFGMTASELTRQTQYQTDELVDIDTEYSRVQIFRTADPANRKPIRVYSTDPYFAQSAMFYDSDELVFPYSKFFDLAGQFTPGFRKALLIGSGAYSYPKHFVQTFPAAEMDVVEIDPMVPEIARRYFRYTDSPRVRTIQRDGREFLNTALAAKYDVVYLDAFGSLFSVPFQLTTREAVSEISRVLNERGVLIANIGSAITGDAGRFLSAEAATYRAVFPQVYIFKVRLERADTDVQNVVLVASKSSTALTLTSDDRNAAELLSHLYNRPLAAIEPVLTDDLAPIEYYNSLASRDFLRRR
jgi:spermidine synthase